MQSSTGGISLPPLDHIGLIVKDLKKTTEYLSSTLGAGPWQIHEGIEYYKEEIGIDELDVGEPFGLKEAQAKLGTEVLEVLQPTDGKRSVYSKFLEANGEGLHHLAYSVPNWEEMVSYLLEHGGRLIACGYFEGYRWYYIETKPGGIVIELTNIPR